MKFLKRHNKEDKDLNLMGFGKANEDIDLIEFNKLDENTDPNLEGAFLVAFDDLPKQKQDKLLELADRMDEKVHQAFQTMDNENLIQHLKYVEVVKVARLGATFSLISTILPWFYALRFYGEIHKAVIDEDNRFMTI